MSVEKVFMYNGTGLARRGEKWKPLPPGQFLYKGCLRGAYMTQTKLCECGCGCPTPIALKTRTKRGQKKGLPLRFINGHNIRLLSSDEQSRRSYCRDMSAKRYTGSKENYVKFYGRHHHRVVAEEVLGRPLQKGEIVHHRDGNKWNNSPSNLEVMTQSEHCRLHLMVRWGSKNAS